MDPPNSFDATGSLTRRYEFYPEEKNKTLFYYNFVAGFEKKIIPIFQAILSIHHVGIIKELFDAWKLSGAKVPKEIRTDGALVLQNGINLSLNGLNYRGYNLKCYKILINEEKNILKMYYCHDVNHLIFTVKRWKCMKSCPSRVSDFYLRSIGYLTQVERLEDFEEVVSSIIIVAKSSLIKVVDQS